MNRYEPRTPRALIGLAAICMTAATLIVSAHVPAALDSTSREVGVLTVSSEPQDHASINSGPLTTSIDVVVYRTTRRVPVVQTRGRVRDDLTS